LNHVESRQPTFRRLVRQGISKPHRWAVWRAVLKIDEVDSASLDYEDLVRRGEQWSKAIETDVNRTFSEDDGFDPDCRANLGRVLRAYAAHDPAVGYCQGMNFIAGILILVASSEMEAFLAMNRLMLVYGLSGFFRHGLPLLRRYVIASLALLQERVPELLVHFNDVQFWHPQYLDAWFMTMFVKLLPIDQVLIVWDVVICEGLPAMLEVALAVLSISKPSLLNCSNFDICRFFEMFKHNMQAKGENAFWALQLARQLQEVNDTPADILEMLVLQDEDEGNDMWGPDLQVPGRSQKTGWLTSFTDLMRSTRSTREQIAHRVAAPFLELGTDAVTTGTGLIQAMQEVRAQQRGQTPPRQQLMTGSEVGH